MKFKQIALMVQFLLVWMTGITLVLACLFSAFIGHANWGGANGVEMSDAEFVLLLVLALSLLIATIFLGVRSFKALVKTADIKAN